MMGAQVWSHVEIESHEYHARSFRRAAFCVACASSVNSVASLPVVSRQV